MAAFSYLGRHRVAILRRRRIDDVPDPAHIYREAWVADDGRVSASVEFMLAHTWHQSGGCDRTDRQEAGRSVGHRCLARRDARAKRGDHLPLSSYLFANRTYRRGAGSVARGGTGNWRRYAA